MKTVTVGLYGFCNGIETTDSDTHEFILDEQTDSIEYHVLRPKKVPYNAWIGTTCADHQVRVWLNLNCSEESKVQVYLPYPHDAEGDHVQHSPDMTVEYLIEKSNCGRDPYDPSPSLDTSWITILAIKVPKNNHNLNVYMSASADH